MGQKRVCGVETALVTSSSGLLWVYLDLWGVTENQPLIFDYGNNINVTSAKDHFDGIPSLGIASAAMGEL